MVSIHLPSVGLREFITFYYFVAADGPIDDFLYPEWGNIRFALQGEWRVVMDGYGPEAQVNVLFGPTDRCGRVASPGGRVAGIGLTPIGWERLLGESAHLMTNRVRTIGDELGPPAGRLRDELALDESEAASVARLDRVLGEAMGRRPATPALLLHLDQMLRMRPTDVVRFAAMVGVSPRSLQRLCLSLYGFAPKRLLRRQRFLDTLGRFRIAVGESLEAALDPKYVDQAHFYRDFRDFMGMSPRAYFKASRALMRRAAQAQEAAGVTLSFELPPTAERP